MGKELRDYNSGLKTPKTDKLIEEAGSKGALTMLAQVLAQFDADPLNFRDYLLSEVVRFTNIDNS